MRQQQKPVANTLEGLSVECTFCSVEMSTHSGGGGTVRYFHCSSCQRWVSSMYQEVFQADTKVRLRATEELRQSAYTAVRERLDRWLRSLDRKDPYRLLGCSPFDSDETLRARYRALAKQHHPDRGGDAATMRSINDAWDQIQYRRASVKQHALAAGA